MYGKFKVLKNYEQCNSCKMTMQAQEKHSNISLKEDLEVLRKGNRESVKCEACFEDNVNSFHTLTVASPFLVLYGNGEVPSNFPLFYDFVCNNHELRYDLLFVSIKEGLSKETNKIIYTSYMKTNKTSEFWYHLEPTSTKGFTKDELLNNEEYGDVSFVVYVCIAALSFMSIHKKMSRKTTKTKIDVTKHFNFKYSIQLVPINELKPYVEFDREKVVVPGKGKIYQENLRKNLLKDGLMTPLILAVSKKTGRAYLYEGNHRMVALIQQQNDWVPLQVTYHFLNDDNNKRFNYIPGPIPDIWPSNPKPEQMAFTVTR